MGLIVQKFGGTSVADVERIEAVAQRAVDTFDAGNQVVVCVSAMAGETDSLVGLAKAVGGEQASEREYDVLVSTGEQKVIALLAMAIQKLGKRARSFTGAQMGMVTDSAHTRARIQDIDGDRLLKELSAGTIAVVEIFCFFGCSYHSCFCMLSAPNHKRFLIF